MELQTTSLIDALANDLRDRILAGDVPAGSGITETELAGRYSVARPTAKAAIEKLVAEGLLRRGSHKTARVPQLSADDVRDLYRSRQLIEQQVVRELATSRTVPPQARLANDKIRSIGDGPSLEVVPPDVRLHQSLVDAFHSARIGRLYASLMGEMRLCMAQVQSGKLLSPSTIAVEHDAILAAIADGDADRAADAVREHLERACSRLAAFAESGPPE